jgi:hypothetical protein
MCELNNIDILFYFMNQILNKKVVKMSEEHNVNSLETSRGGPIYHTWAEPLQQYLGTLQEFVHQLHLSQFS